MTDKKQKTAVEIEEALMQMQDTTTLTKKQIEELTGFSDNSVFKIIEVSGLPTSHREYTVASLKERFVSARKLLDAGATYEEVKKKMASVAQDKKELQKSDEERFGSAMGQLDAEIGEAVFEIVKDRVRAATQYLPEMIQAALTEEIESGNTRKVLMERVSASIKQQKKGTPIQGAMGGLSKFLPKKVDTTPLLPSVDEEKDQ